MPGYAFLGGAFDPIHNGHIRLLAEVHKRLSFTKLFFMPYGLAPTGKSLQATNRHREEMIASILKEQPHFDMEGCELHAKQPSYTEVTMQRLHSRYGNNMHLSLIMGADSYASIRSWRRWEHLAELVHFIVFNRRGVELSDSLRQWEAARQVHKEEFFQHPAGKVLHIETPFMDFSSTEIRAKIRRGQDIEHLLPPSVHRYIKENNLYRR